MPRSTKSRGVREEGNVAILEQEEEGADMTTAQGQEVDEDDGPMGDPRFSFESQPAPEDFTPDRKTPGRVRQPSYFDDILRADDVFNSNRWQMVPVSSKEHAEAVQRELNRAKLHLNKTGLEASPPLPEIGLDLDVRDDAVYYRSRTAQKRERKNGNGVVTDTDSAEEIEYDEDETDDEE